MAPALATTPAPVVTVDLFSPSTQLSAPEALRPCYDLSVHTLDICDTEFAQVYDGQGAMEAADMGSQGRAFLARCCWF